MEKQGFDLAMHYFRAFAIFSVICGSYRLLKATNP